MVVIMFGKIFQMPEEEAFAVLVKLMQDYKMRDMFKPTMAELGLCMYQLENLVQVYIVIYLDLIFLVILKSNKTEI